MDVSPEAWGFLGILAAQFGAGYAVWLKVRKSEGKIDEAKETAEETRELARPTGNGYAATTIKLLNTALHEIREVKTDVRDLRHEVAADRDASVRHREAFIRHVDNHNIPHVPPQRVVIEPEEGDAA